MTQARSRRYLCMPRPVIAAGAYSLSTVQDEDIESIRQWRNAQMDVLRQTAPISPEQQRTYFAQQIWPSMDTPTPTNILLAFREDERLIGYGGLVHLSWEHRRGEVSFLLDSAYVSNQDEHDRLFAEYLGLIAEFAFTDLGLHRLTAETYAIREAHIRVMEANGFVREGRLRDHVLIDGVYVDSLVHGWVSP